MKLLMRISLTLIFLNVALCLSANAKDAKLVFDEVHKAYPEAELIISVYEGKKRQILGTRGVKLTSLFEIGSATKWFTAISVLQLIEQGKLKLDTPVSSILTDPNLARLSQIGSNNYWPDITIEMLLNHTSGIKDYIDGFGSDEKALAYFKDPEQVFTFNDKIGFALSFGDANFKPGEKWKYCNTEYVLLGKVISKVSKKTWQEYFKDQFFSPLGMENTFLAGQLTSSQKSRILPGHYNKIPAQIPYTLAGSAGGIISRAEDLHRFLKAYRENKLFQTAQSKQIQLIRGFQPMIPNLIDYGYGVFKIGDLLGHSGQTFGFQSFIGIDLKTGKQIVILVNNAAVNTLGIALALQAKEGREEEVKGSSLLLTHGVN